MTTNPAPLSQKQKQQAIDLLHTLKRENISTENLRLYYFESPLPHVYLPIYAENQTNRFGIKKHGNQSSVVSHTFKSFNPIHPDPLRNLLRQPPGARLIADETAVKTLQEIPLQKENITVSPALEILKKLLTIIPLALPLILFHYNIIISLSIATVMSLMVHEKTSKEFKIQTWILVIAMYLFISPLNVFRVIGMVIIMITAFQYSVSYISSKDTANRKLPENNQPPAAIPVLPVSAPLQQQINTLTQELQENLKSSNPQHRVVAQSLLQDELPTTIQRWLELPADLQSEQELQKALQEIREMGTNPTAKIQAWEQQKNYLSARKAGLKEKP